MGSRTGCRRGLEAWAMDHWPMILWASAKPEVQTRPGAGPGYPTADRAGRTGPSSHGGSGTHGPWPAERPAPRRQPMGASRGRPRPGDRSPNRGWRPGPWPRCWTFRPEPWARRSQPGGTPSAPTPPGDPPTTLRPRAQGFHTNLRLPADRNSPFHVLIASAKIPRNNGLASLGKWEHPMRATEDS